MSRYVTLASVKEAGSLDDEWDALLMSVIAAAEDEIDNLCSRHFDAYSETRQFRCEDPTYLDIRDWLSITSVEVDGTTIEPFNYEPEVLARRGWPKYGLRFTGNCPSMGDIVEIDGRWGWPAVPAAISAAARIGALKLFARSEHPTGVIATDGDIAYLPGTDPDIKRLCHPYSNLRLIGAG